MLSAPLQLGPLALPGRVILAPLAGVTDVPFRRICSEFGASLTYVEMLNAVAVRIESRTTMALLSRHATERVLGAQVTGSRPEQVAQAVRFLDARGFDTIDLNMGCPVRKVVGSGCGSGFLKDIPRLRATVEACRAATAKPLTVKIRLGYTPDTVNVEETSTILAGAGIEMLTIHGRTREDTYAVRVSHPGIAAGIAAARAVHPGIVTVGNGDILDVQAARTMVERTGCDAVMLSRGALGNPWLFRQILRDDPAQPSVSEWMDVVLRHLDYQEQHYGDTQPAARMMRKHLIWYAKGFRDAKRLRELCTKAETLAEARATVCAYAATLPADLPRFADNSGANHDPKFDMDRELDRGAGTEGL